MSELESYIKEYIQEQRRKGQAKSTISSKQDHLNQFLFFAKFKDINIQNITRKDIQDFIIHYEDRGYSEIGIQNRYYTLRNFLKYLDTTYEFYGWNWNEDSENPADRAGRNWDRTPRFNKKLPKEKQYLDIAEYEIILDACNTTREKIIIEGLWNTGVRVAEFVEIETDYINQDERRIEVQSKKRQNYSSRYVYYRPSYGTTLNDWLQQDRKQYISSEKNNYLLPTIREPEKNGHLSTAHVQRMVKEIGWRANEIADEPIQEVAYEDSRGKQARVTPHIFRTSYIVHRVKNNMPLPFLRQLVGHKDLSVTQEYYIKFSDEDVKQAYRNHPPEPR